MQAVPQRYDALTYQSKCSHSVLMTRKRRIPEDTADYARWLADQIEDRGPRLTLRLSPTAAMFVGMALRGYARLLDGKEAAGMIFTVSDCDGGRVEMLAACKAPEIAWAAYHLAIASRPDRKIVLRHGDRIVGEHGQNSEPVMIENHARSG